MAESHALVKATMTILRLIQFEAGVFFSARHTVAAAVTRRTGPQCWVIQHVTTLNLSA